MPEPSRPDDAQLPLHPDRVEDPEPRDHSGWAGIVIVALLGALVVLMIVLHLAGMVGPGSH